LEDNDEPDGDQDEGQVDENHQTTNTTSVRTKLEGKLTELETTNNRYASSILTAQRKQKHKNSIEQKLHRYRRTEVATGLLVMGCAIFF
jgi:hypothetical protein